MLVASFFWLCRLFAPPIEQAEEDDVEQLSWKMALLKKESFKNFRLFDANSCDKSTKHAPFWLMMIKSETEDIVLPTHQLPPELLTPEHTPTSSRNTHEKIRTLVFFHPKATALPWVETKYDEFDRLTKSCDPLHFSQTLKNNMLKCTPENCPRMTELSFVAVPREEFERSIGRMKDMFCSELPSLLLDHHATKLILQFNHGVTDEHATQDCLERGEGSPLKRVRYANETFSSTLRATFRDQFHLIKSFLDSLAKPACLVAHAGINYGYLVLYGELLRNLATENIPVFPDIFFVDAMFAFKHLENRFLAHLKSILNIEYSSPNSPPHKHPWQFLKDKEASVAVLKRFGPDRFVKKENEPWKLLPGSLNLKLLDLYKGIIGERLKVEFAEEQSLALMMVSLSYGMEFLEYLDSVKALLPY